MIPGLEHYKQKWSVNSEQIIKPGLDAIRKALKLVDNPQECLKVVHIAGTNGKGSTLTFLESIARQHGLTVGKFMSPCVIDVHDQIQINGMPITEQQMDAIFSDMYQAGLSGCLTDFELLTVACFMYFQRQKVDLVLLEVGMGGRFDSTNVITPLVSIIPSVALEHTNFLGTTLQEIAGHKAGIIKLGCPVVVGKVPKEALQVIEEEAFLQKAPLFVLGEHIHVKSDAGLDVYTNNVKGISIGNLNRKMVGIHQAENMALAITAFMEAAPQFHVAIEYGAIRKGVAEASLAGRFEEVYPNIFFDGAHNPASAHTLVATIKELFPNSEIHFVVGILADKDVAGVLRILEQVSNHFAFVDFDNERAMKAEEILALSAAEHKCIVNNVMTYIQKTTKTNCVTFVTGSLYLLTSLRNLLAEFSQN